ncbi:MAG: hypothetical protein ACLP6E_00735 [Acidimicrobiales bacterium]
MKILATMGFGKHEEFLAVTRPSFERYAAIHGYELRVPEVDPAPERNHKQWAKVAFINQLLPTCDFLFWIDADAAIVDCSADIAEELTRGHFLGMVEHRYGGQRVPNTGVMAVRSGRYARRFFGEMWDHTQYLETRWHDNAAALEMFGYEFDPEAKPLYCQPGRDTPWLRRTHFLGNEWNSMPQDMALTPRIVHVTGSFPFEERLTLLSEALSKRASLVPASTRF